LKCIRVIGGIIATAEVDVDIVNSVCMRNYEWTSFGAMMRVRAVLHIVTKEDNESKASHAGLSEIGSSPLLNMVKRKVLVFVENT
jgi:hypothetical protein